MVIGRNLFAVVLVGGVLALIGIGVAVNDYTGSISTLQRVEFDLVSVERVSPDQLDIRIRVRNASRFVLDIQALHLAVSTASSEPAPIGAAYERFSLESITPHATAEVARVLQVRDRDVLESSEGRTLRFEGQAWVRLPLSERAFPYPLDFVWTLPA